VSRLFVLFLFAAAEVSHVAVQAANEAIGSGTRFFDELGITIVFIRADVEVVQQLIDGAASHSADSKVFLKMPATVPFRDVVGDGNRRSSHLWINAVPFASRQLSDEAINPDAELARSSIKLKIV
jgi:hypothetical protein